MKEEFFYKSLDVNNNHSVLDKFYSTLLETNRTYSFFTDWDKIISKYKKCKIELNIFNSLIGDENFDETLRYILINYPNIIPIIPLLLAIRNINFTILDFYEKQNFILNNYNFAERNLTEEEIKDIIIFFSKTGLKEFFQKLSHKSIPDYYIGVEVGLDSHARKNRSGKIMEDFILGKLNIIKYKNKNSFEIITQKKYDYLKSNYGFNITNALSNRKADFILIINYKKIIAIETNFYSDTGSKPQEIVNSYIQRHSELKKLGIEFIWITDGQGWKKQQNQMNFAFERLDYILNIDFIKKGLLEEIIMSI